jgi:hypothetical protein
VVLCQEHILPTLTFSSSPSSQASSPPWLWGIQ